MIVVADGDVAKNDFQRSNGQIFPLGFDRNTKQTFANRIFLLNCVNYLLDDEGMLQLRSREVKLRLQIGHVVRVLDGPLAPIPCASRTQYQRCEDCDEATCQATISVNGTSQGTRRRATPAPKARAPCSDGAVSGKACTC